MNKLVWDEAERMRRLNLDFIDLTSGMFVRPSVRAFWCITFEPCTLGFWNFKYGSLMKK